MVGGRYQLLELLGWSPSASVWLGRDAHKRKAAIKASGLNMTAMLVPEV